MNPLVLLGGAAAALLLLARGSGGKGGIKVGETPDQERALLTKDKDGWHLYRPEYRPMLVQRLKTLTIHESGTDPRLSVLGEASGIVSSGSSAYQAVQAMHAMGFNIWVSPTLMSPTPQARWLWAASPANGEYNPPEAWKGKLALLVSAYDEPFPGDLVTNVPPPPPEAPPPPPVEAIV